MALLSVPGACPRVSPSGGRRSLAVLLAATLLGAVAAPPAAAVRIKDITTIKGVRTNQLVGYGLVVGLDGSGDGNKSPFTVQSMAAMLAKMGVTVDPATIKPKNVAAVMVTAELPAFAGNGTRLDALVSSVGDASNLQGGTLLLTPLKGIDGRVYAIVQGAVSTGGFQAQGSGASVQKNFPTVGRVVGGVVVEREVPHAFAEQDHLTFVLRQPDFTTAARVAESINTALGRVLAATRDAATVRVTVPPAYTGRLVSLITQIEGLDVTPDTVSKVVVNERTGTVVMGENVRIATIALAHGSLSIHIKEKKDVSQPMPLSQGQTAVTNETDIAVDEENPPILLLDAGVSLGEVVRALNALGVSPRDLIAIFQALKAAGALQAELEII